MTLKVKMSNGDIHYVERANRSSEDLLEHLMIADGGWVHVDVKDGYSYGIWLNTAQIVSIEEGYR